MILLNATEISKSYTASPLLSKLSYAINEGDKIGLIGVNGTGQVHTSADYGRRGGGGQRQNCSDRRRANRLSAAGPGL